jgi:hypothetical protein
MMRPATALRVLTAAGVLLCSPFAPGRAAAASPTLAGLPSDRVALGDAFVEAWVSLRRDLDAADGAGVHPALLKAWLAAIPRSVLRDVARIASDQHVAFLAAAQLSDGARDEDRLLLADLERRYSDTPDGAAMSALRIVARDRAALRAAEEKLASHEPLVALDGAVALAAARDGRGLAHLRRSIERGDPVSSYAARALGRFGTEADVALLAAARSRGIDPDAIGVGIGEIAIRRTFPLHAEMLARRDPSGRRFDAVGGLYDTWLTVIGEAVAGGARDLTGLLAHVDRVRAKAVGDAGEVVQRELQALVDFWTEVEACIRATAPTVAWPARFDEASVWISSRDGKGAVPEQYARRVAAAIAVLASAEDPLGYGRLSTPTPGMVMLNAGSGRAADGNLATSWRGAPGAVLEIEIAPGTTVERLWIASPCDGAPGASVREVRVRGRSSDGVWSISRRFERASGYFEALPLGAERSGRLYIEIVEAVGKVACVAEIRGE